MITFISDALFILYIFCFLWRQFPFINTSGQRKGEEKNIAIILIGVVYLMFYSYDSILVEPIQCNRIAVSDAEGLSEKEIVNKILIREFDHYKSERLFTKNKIFDYTINRIDGPIKIKDKDGMDKNYYDISYSVKTIDPAWIAGNGKNEGLWVNNKSGFFVLIKNDNQYILKHVGGL